MEASIPVEEDKVNKNLLLDNRSQNRIIYRAVSVIETGLSRYYNRYTPIAIAIGAYYE